jgi:hypothetical protein
MTYTSGGEAVSGLGHEVHTAEHDERGSVRGGVTGELEAVPTRVGELK